MRTMRDDNTTPTNSEIAHHAVSFDDVSAAAMSLQDDGTPVTVEAVRDLLGAGSVNAIYKHLNEWRAHHAKPFEAPKAEIPESIIADLGNWARRFAEEAGAGVRDTLAQSESDLDALLKAGEQLEGELDQALLTISERDEVIERLNAELRNARQIAMDALVGKAKDQLAIEGKDSQLAALRQQLERNVAASAAESDARLAAEMELVGAVTARESLAAEIKDLRAEIERLRAGR